MNFRYSLMYLANQTEIVVGNYYLDSLKAGNVRAATMLSYGIIEDFVISSGERFQKQLAKAGSNLAVSLMLAITEQRGRGVINQLEKLIKVADLARTIIRAWGEYTHEIFAFALRSQLQSLYLLTHYCQEYDHNENAGDAIYAASDMLAITALSLHSSTSSCRELAKILIKNNGNRDALNDFVLGLDTSSTKTLEREIALPIEGQNIDESQLEEYKEIEKKIWQASHWEMFELHQQAIIALHKATPKKVLTTWDNQPKPRILPPLAIRSDVKNAIQNLQDCF